MRVGCVQYINALPYRISLNINDLKLAHPTTLNEMMRQGLLDCVLTSSVLSWQHSLQTLPYGIVSDGEVLSVNLYHKKEIGKSTIALPEESATSIALLKVLCAHFWKVKPVFVRMDQEHDAKLIIGDKALLYLQEEGEQMVDLGLAWKDATGLPFVFAQWMGKKECDLNAFAAQLESSLAYAERHPEQLLSLAAKQSGIDSALLKKYYSKLLWRIGKKEVESIHLFRELNVQQTRS